MSREERKKRARMVAEPAVSGGYYGDGEPFVRLEMENVEGKTCTWEMPVENANALAVELHDEVGRLLLRDIETEGSA